MVTGTYEYKDFQAIKASLGPLARLLLFGLILNITHQFILAVAKIVLAERCRRPDVHCKQDANLLSAWCLGTIEMEHIYYTGHVFSL